MPRISSNILVLCLAAAACFCTSCDQGVGQYEKDQQEGRSEAERISLIRAVAFEKSYGTSNSYIYLLPEASTGGGSTATFNRDARNAASDIERGNMTNAKIIVASPSSDEGVRLVDIAFAKVAKGRLRGATLVFLGARGDKERVEIAIKGSGAALEFVEVSE